MITNHKVFLLFINIPGIPSDVYILYTSLVYRNLCLFKFPAFCRNARTSLKTPLRGMCWISPRGCRPVLIRRKQQLLFHNVTMEYQSYMQWEIVQHYLFLDYIFRSSLLRMHRKILLSWKITITGTVDVGNRSDLMDELSANISYDLTQI